MMKQEQIDAIKKFCPGVAVMFFDTVGNECFGHVVKITCIGSDGFVHFELWAVEPHSFSEIARPYTYIVSSERLTLL